MKDTNHLRKAKSAEIVESTDIGVSFSLLSCTEYDIAWRDALKSTLDLGFKRFRLMSYWNLHEKNQGSYDFAELDEQLKIIESRGGRVSLSIGIRQPRYPETHMPKWTENLSAREVTSLYMKYHTAVIERYKDSPCIESWQLENEFWLRSFGENFDYSRTRLKQEFAVIRNLDPSRPIIMTLASVVSLPLGRPTPDIYGTSMYRVIYNSESQKYTTTWAKPWVYKIKKFFIKLIKNRNLIVHELQAEPWGPKANWEMSTHEQFKSINSSEVEKSIAYAKASGITYIDMWGAEWWYWRKMTYTDTGLQETVSKLIHPSTIA